MARALLWAGCAATVVAVAVWRVQMRTGDQTAVFDPPIRHIEPAPLCPWREPDADMRAIYPAGTRYSVETHILSGKRVELTKELGRMPEPEENVITLYRIFAEAEKIGVVMTKRVKGEHGAIELVLGLDKSNKVLAVRLQRLREPPSIASHLSSAWLEGFRGQAHGGGSDSNPVSKLPEEARVSGLAISEGVRSLLTMNAMAASGQSTPGNGKARVESSHN